MVGGRLQKESRRRLSFNLLHLVLVDQVQVEDQEKLLKAHEHFVKSEASSNDIFFFQEALKNQCRKWVRIEFCLWISLCARGSLFAGAGG